MEIGIQSIYLKMNHLAQTVLKYSLYSTVKKPFDSVLGNFLDVESTSNTLHGNNLCILLILMTIAY